MWSAVFYLLLFFPLVKQLLANQANRQIVDMFGLADRENLIRKEETYYQETTNPLGLCRWPLRAPSLV